MASAVHWELGQMFLFFACARWTMFYETHLNQGGISAYHHDITGDHKVWLNWHQSSKCSSIAASHSHCLSLKGHEAQAWLFVSLRRIQPLSRAFYNQKSMCAVNVSRVP